MTSSAPGQRERTWSGLFAGFHIDPRSGVITPSFAGLEQAVLVLGPPRCGKTSCFVVGSVLDAPGAVVSTSTKPDVLEATGPFRSSWGRVYVFDPAGTVPLPSYAQQLRWSPVSGCESFEFAVATAHHLASAARPGASLSEAAHWVERARGITRSFVPRCGNLGKDSRRCHAMGARPRASRAGGDPLPARK